MKDKGILLDQVNVIRNKQGLITGGLLIGNITEQNQATIITMCPAELKEAPMVGVGISSALMSEEILLYKHKIRQQLEADGQRVSYLSMSVTVDNKTDIQLNANY